MTNFEDTIIAPATPSGVSALAVIRVSGKDALTIVNSCFSKEINHAKGYSIHYGHILDGTQKVDEVLVSIFKNPQSYTGEDSVEISGHGSPYIVQRIIETILKKGARMAEPGEFTLRAFLNKKLDLTQAEAVADMISSNSEASLQMAIHQMRGGFSKDIAKLRQELIDFAALIELENDFGEEDVEFANRPKLKSLIESLLHQIEKLRTSFSAGNVLKNGINTVIAGKPNAGKSTLLNSLLNEDRAIVSDVAGTTRDTIEEIFTLKGIQFRLIDTAGLRDSSDNIEQIGVSKAKESIQKADLIIYIFDAQTTNRIELESQLKELPPSQRLIILANKTDKQAYNTKDWPENTLFISAKTKNIDPLLDELLKIASQYEFGNETLVNNARHADALSKSSILLQKIITGINEEIPSDLIAIDIRNTLYQLGLITGEVTNDEVLDSIFTRFCIGK